MVALRVGHSDNIMAIAGVPKYAYPFANKGDTLEDYECIAFLIPKGWWNRASIIGAFYHMGFSHTWPDDDYGKEVADAWRACYWLSRESNFMMETNVYITNQIEGGGGCCDTTTNVEVIVNAGQPVTVEPNIDSPLPVVGVEEIPEFAEENGATTIGEYDELRCKIANWMADRIVADVSRFNNIIGILKGEVAEGLSARIAAAITLAYSDGPYFIGDIAGAILILSPKVFNWIISTAYPGDIQNLGITVDREAMVSIFYDAETSSDWGDIFFNVIQPAIDSAPVSQELKDVYETYFRFWYGTRLANWYASNAKNLIENLIPDDYVPPTPCGSPAAQLYYDFNDGTTQGWTFYQTRPYSTSQNVGGLAVDAIEGSHSLNLDMPYNLGNGQTDTSEWIIDVEPNIVMAQGDKISFSYEYIGVHSYYFQIRFYNTLNQSQNVTSSVFPSGGGSGFYEAIMPSNPSHTNITHIGIRAFASGVQSSTSSGRFKIDQIGIFAASLES